MKPIKTIEDYKNQLINYVTKLKEKSVSSFGYIFAANDFIKYLNGGFNKAQTITEFKMELVNNCYFMASFKGQRYSGYCDCLKDIICHVLGD